MTTEFKYSFGAYSGDDLKEVVEKYTFEAQNHSFDKTLALMELCVGIVCKLIVEGIRFSFQEVVEIWKKVS